MLQDSNIDDTRTGSVQRGIKWVASHILDMCPLCHQSNLLLQSLAVTSTVPIGPLQAATILNYATVVFKYMDHLKSPKQMICFSFP